MVTTIDILQRGYFPKELPPPFSTTSFANDYLSLGKTTSENSSVCLKTSYSKFGTIRRTISIPNPAHFITLAESISQNWNKIINLCLKSELSRTIPKIDNARAVTGTHNLNDIPILRTEIRTGARYIVKVDIANFYGSIYTHAIPWAFHTKPKAKANRTDDTLFGNTLDRGSRNIQSGQTVGLPVGPDTSFVLAESVLCAVDFQIQERLKSANLNNVRGFRFIDDYEFAVNSLSDAELVRNFILDSLGEFELLPNPRKTFIKELPQALDTTWVHELSTFQIEPSKKRMFESHLIRYFTRAFELAQTHPGDPVLKYALYKLNDIDPEQAISLFYQLLFHTATIDVGTLPTALYLAYKHQESNKGQIDTALLSRAISAIIDRHAPLQHGGDVAWALWGAIVFGIRLNDTVVNALDKLNDPIAMLMAFFAEQEGAFSHRSLDRYRWQINGKAKSKSHTSKEKAKSESSSPKSNIVSNEEEMKNEELHELYDSNWLFVYEAVGHGWITPTEKDPALSDDFFDKARRKGISFFNTNVPRIIPRPLMGEY